MCVALPFFIVDFVVEVLTFHTLEGAFRWEEGVPCLRLSS